MTEENNSAIGRQGDGSAGTPRGVSKRDQIPSGAERAGRKNDELEWARQHAGEEGVLRKKRGVFRKTELHGILPEDTPEEAKRIRKRTMESLKGPASVISYQPFEKAFRDFICSLLERQDLLEDKILLHDADLQQQIDALEQSMEQLRPASAAAPEVKA
jgi:hypothetical protein